MIFSGETGLSGGREPCSLSSDIGLPFTEPNPLRFSLWINDGPAFCIGHDALRPDAQIPTLNGLASQLHELFGVLRGIK